MTLGDDRGSNEPDAASQMLVYAGAAVAALAGAVWATGELAGRIAGGAWPSVPLSEIAGVMGRLPATAADPARAWPEPAAALLPGPTGMYLAFTAILAMLGLLAAGATTAYHHLTVHSNDNGPPAAGWATPRQLRELLVAEPARGRLTLGRLPHRGRRKKLVAAEAGQSVAVVGPTRSGKTTGVAIPAILEWDGPAVVASVKADLLNDTLAWREQQGDVWVYDPTGASGIPPSTWSPLSACATWEGARRTAWAMAAAARHGSGGLSEAQFWYSRASKLLAPLLFAAAQDERTIADVVRWVDTEDQTEPYQALQRADVAEALAAFDATAQKDPKHLSSIYSTAEEVLDAYADPSVASSARSCEIDANRLLDGGHHTLYLSAPADDQARLRPLFAALLQWLLRDVRRRAHTPTGPPDPPLLVVLDEAANIAPLHDLDTIATTAAEQGLQLVTVWQDLAQIRARYNDRADTIIANHRALLTLPGSKDRATLDHVSQLAGDTDLTRESTTRDGHGRRSTTEAVEHRRLVPDHAVRTLTGGHAVLVYGSLPPALVKIRPWYRERRSFALKGAAHDTGSSGGPLPLGAGAKVRERLLVRVRRTCHTRS